MAHGLDQPPRARDFAGFRGRREDVVEQPLGIRRRGIEAEHIISWDDFDRFRKVPNVEGVDESWAEHIGKPLPNAALLGAFAATTGQVRLASVLQAIEDRFATKIAAANQRAAQAAHDYVVDLLSEVVDA